MSGNPIPCFERRAARRHAVEIPLALQCGSGVSRNLSAGGMLFATLERFEPGRHFPFTLHPFDSPPVHGWAEVLRVVERDGHCEVAAAIRVSAGEQQAGD